MMGWKHKQCSWLQQPTHYILSEVVVDAYACTLSIVSNICRLAKKKKISRAKLKMNLHETIIWSILFLHTTTAFTLSNRPTTRYSEIVNNHVRKSRQTIAGKSALAGSLKEYSQMVNTGSDEFPNWRLLTNEESQRTSVNKVSHFFHIIEGDEEDSNTSVASAAWSNEAYEAALEKYEAFVSCTDSYIEPFIQDALHTLDQSYRLYGPESVIGSFNGGKDAVVILELMCAAHANYFRSLEGRGEGKAQPTRPRVIYFNNKLEFPEVYDFVQHTVKEYDLDMLAFEEGIGFVGGLEMLVKRNYLISNGLEVSRTHPMAFVLGTRAADPNAGKQGSFAPSSSYMPPFMRVNPVLKWSYGHVWHFLRLYKLPYCSLYDEGYTSLGTVKDTFPCPALKKVHLQGDAQEYWPAYMLKDWDQERAGRVKKDKKKKDGSSSKKEKILEREADTISKCSTVVSLPSTKAPPEILDEVEPKAVDPHANNSESDSDDVSSIGSNSTVSQRTVGIIIIGDEILKGLTPDTNTHSAATALKANNVPLSRVVVVSDDQDEIVAEIKKMRGQVDVIITSGGVGPTHDDVTIKSVASALENDLVLNEEMAQLLKSKMNDGADGDQPLTEAQVKMSTLPACSKLRNLSGEEGDWPVLQCENIFILPGVPQFFEKKVAHVAKYLSTEFGRRVAFKVVLSVDENSIVPILNNVVENHKTVTFGSYPFVDHKEFKTVVTLEGGCEKDVNVKVALAALVNGLPEGSVLRVDNNNDLIF